MHENVTYIKGCEKAIRCVDIDLPLRSATLAYWSNSTSCATAIYRFCDCVTFVQGWYRLLLVDGKL